MPFTPFHFGPSACLALPGRRYIDLPVFLLANVAVDLEPLAVMTLDLPYPLHGLAHTFLGAALIGIACGFLANHFRQFLSRIMKEMLRLEYSPSLSNYIVAGIAGTWFHVLLDSAIYNDIRPFFPFSNANPFLGYIEQNTLYAACAASFIPAAAIYAFILFNERCRMKPGDLPVKPGA